MSQTPEQQPGAAGYASHTCEPSLHCPITGRIVCLTRRSGIVDRDTFINSPRSKLIDWAVQGFLQHNYCLPLANVCLSDQSGANRISVAVNVSTENVVTYDHTAVHFSTLRIASPWHCLQSGGFGGKWGGRRGGRECSTWPVCARAKQPAIARVRIGPECVIG